MCKKSIARQDKLIWMNANKTVVAERKMWMSKCQAAEHPDLQLYITFEMDLGGERDTMTDRKSH